ncbi:MAG: sodium:solute symporter, partial [Lentihominibacter sp.]
AFLAPFLYSLYWKGVTKAACWCSYIWGAGLMILNLLFRESFPMLLQSPINCGAFAMLAGFIIVPVVSWITRKPDHELVDGCFACYDKTVRVPAKFALSEEDKID